MKANQTYMWEMETKDGQVIKQYEVDKETEEVKENSWKSLNPDDVVRVSMVPRLPVLPQHNVIINHKSGERFIKRFGRGFIRVGSGTGLKEYVNCVVTNRYRLWVFSNGSCTVTDRNYEVHI